MPPVCDPILDSIKNHWNFLRAGRIAPFRAEIDPNAFEAALGHMFILERIIPGDVRIRLAGTRICDLMGMEVRGMPLSAFMSDAFRNQLDGIIGVTLDNPSTAELSLVATDANGNQFPAALLLLPLRCDFGDISRVIGCISFEAENLHLPVRMAIREENVLPIEIGTHISSEHPLPGFYEQTAVFSHAHGPALRKVVDNRGIQHATLQGRPSPLRLVHSSAKPRDE